MKKTRVLTGITTTGTPHLGNYVGAIRPAIKASDDPNVESFYFLADYHALIKCDDPARIQQSTLEIAASWLACGLDPEKVYFYRQSDIPEIPELTWLLTCVTAKGLLNRAHAYKAATDANRAAGEDPDSGVTAGLYMYPVLMAADILIFNANKVPVGRDQIQHIEMARDIGQRFNHLYKGEFFELPEAEIEKNVATLPGLDGRKMSKSYNNTIPLFQGGEHALRKAIFSMVTDTTKPTSFEAAAGSALHQLIAAFVIDDPALSHAITSSMIELGSGWGALKEIAVNKIEEQIGGYRQKYEQLIARPSDIEDKLRMGAKRAREIAKERLELLRDAVGLRPLQNIKILSANATAGATAEASLKVSKTPYFTQFKNEDGTFSFKLFDSSGTLLVQGSNFASPRDAASALAAIKTQRPLLTDGSGTRVMSGPNVIAELKLLKSDVEAVLDQLIALENAKKNAKSP
ncbi:MAG TPA: tryptophan--tRNA ligase [Rudaea sp.]